MLGLGTLPNNHRNYKEGNVYRVIAEQSHGGGSYTIQYLAEDGMLADDADFAHEFICTLDAYTELGRHIHRHGHNWYVWGVQQAFLTTTWRDLK